MLHNAEITKKELLVYLKDLGKEYRKISGKRNYTEIILVGGASVLLNYGFRDMTADVDALIVAASTMKEAIFRVAAIHNLSPAWLNTDFSATPSFTDKLLLYSVYSRTYSNVIQLRTIKDEYLIAMKLVSGRDYKYDLSDILGILMENERKQTPLSRVAIDKAVYDLYGGYNRVSEHMIAFIEKAFNHRDFLTFYNEIRKLELRNSKYIAEASNSNMSLQAKEINSEYLLDLLKMRLSDKQEIP